MNKRTSLTWRAARAAAPWLLASAGLMASSPPATWAEIALTQLSPKLSVSGSLRVRGEFWNWFDPTGTQDNDYAFVATVARGAVRWKDDAFDVVLEAQNSSLMNLPADAAAPPPQGALGLGAVYFAHNRRQ